MLSNCFDIKPSPIICAAAAHACSAHFLFIKPSLSSARVIAFYHIGRLFFCQHHFLQLFDKLFALVCVKVNYFKYFVPIDLGQ